MKRLPLMIAGCAAATAILPFVASAQALTQAVGLFNIFVGLMLVASLLAYGTSFVVWVTRLGNWPSYRGTAIHIGEWAVIILFVLFLILTAVQFFHDHPRAAAVTTGTIVLILIVGVILYLALHGEEKKERER